MERWQCKLVAFFVMLVIMLVAMLVPFKVVSIVRRQGQRGTAVILTLTCFTGGVFFGTCLLFLIPEVSFLVNSAMSLLTSSAIAAYPLGELIAGVGFFTIMFIERAVVEFFGQSPDQVVNHQAKNVKVVSSSDNKTAATYSETLNRRLVEDRHKMATDHDEENCRESFTGSETCSGDRDNATASRLSNNTGSRRSLTPNSVDDDANGNDNVAAAVAIISFENYSLTKTVVLFIALSLDCFLGGVSLGLQRYPAAVWTVLVGILAHETVVGFGLGLQLAERVTNVGNDGRRSKAGLLMAIAYALVGPAGVVVGALMTELSGSSSVEDSAHLTLVNGVLQGFATGVFVYVTFFELLEGKMNSNSRYRDLFAIMIGFALMAAIAMVPSQGPEEHSVDVYNSTLLNNITTPGDIRSFILPILKR